MQEVHLCVCQSSHNDTCDAPQQVMVLLTGAVGQGKPVALKLQALHGWAVLVQALLDHAPTQLANVMHQVLTILSCKYLICFGQTMCCLMRRCYASM